MKRTNAQWLVGLICLLAGLAGCGTAGEAEAEVAAASSDEALTSSCPPLPADVDRHLHGRGRAALDRLHTLDHYVPIARGRWIHLRETFSLRAFLRPNRRALLMLPGPITTGEVFQLDVDGYRGRDIIANEGAFAFTADFEGTGESSVPADGRSPNQPSQVAAMQTVLRYIRLIRGIGRVDVLGESWGGGVAAELCADRVRVRSCTIASIFYRTPSEFANQVFRSPEWRGFLDSLPDGYLPTNEFVYAGLTAAMEPPVAAAFVESQSGIYPTAPLYDVFDLPYFDPSNTRVPGLLIQGELDPNQGIDDALDLVADYAGPMELVVVEGGGHIPRTQPSPYRDIYWDAVLDFLEL
jgi:pimeloyl-ACP methyl ester carboxylesterase